MDLERMVELEYLGLTEEDVKDLTYPLVNLSSEPHLQVLRLMRDPNYFHFTCKYLFNIELPPFQSVLLKELWQRRFPMLVGSRGLGKCINGDSMVVANDGFKTIKEVVGDSLPHEKVYLDRVSLLGENGFNEVDYGWNNGVSETRKISTRYGYRIESTLNHPMRVVRDGEIVWLNADEVKIGDRVPIERGGQWFPQTNDMSPEVAYALGLLIGDGGYTVRGRMSYTTADPELVPPLTAIWQRPFKKIKAKYNYILYGVKEWDSLYSEFGFRGTTAGDKDFPLSILSASRESMAAFIRGLFDTDGTANKNNLGVEYTSKSPKLAETMQFVLLRFGIVSKVVRRINKKYGMYYYYLSIGGRDAELFAKEIGFGLKRKQKILLSRCGQVKNTNVDTIPHGLADEDLLEVSRNWRLVRPKMRRGYSLERQFVTPSRITSYEYSYDNFSRFLNLTSPVSDNASWGKLSNVLDSHYFYDSVTSIEAGEATTYDVCMKSVDDKSFISNGFISHNSFLLGLYAVLRAVLIQGSKIVITGSGFRQAKTVFNYSESIWHNSPVLRSLFAGGSRVGPSHDADRWSLRLGDSIITALPIGSGDRIRGERANCTIGDEFASIPREIFETVIAGFGVVNLSPVAKVRERARIRVLKKLGQWSAEAQEDMRKNELGNQMIISGTAYYQFNHFAEYWKRWKEIVESQGDEKKLMNAFGGEIPVGMDWRDYSVIRIPVDLLPPGYMDEQAVARSKATVHSGTYMNEFGAVFSSDSNGFFQRSMIEKCVTTKPVVPNAVDAMPVQFRPMIRGNISSRYVMGVDPASEHDNFSIVIVEIRENHRRIVYCWTTDKERFRAKVNANLVQVKDYYGYCARKIRELMRSFPCEIIALDTQGGGNAVLEALHDPDKMEQGELPIWPVTPDHILSDKKPRDIDVQPGLHIVNLINFAKADWVSEANHGLRKDFEDRVLLFPMQDSVMLFEANMEDQLSKKIYDTLEECVDEIEELKDELTTIEHSQTPGSLRDHWDTPEIKISGSRKGRMRKDRYSALLMANSAARRLHRQFELPELMCYGGFTSQMIVTADNQEMYSFAPAWFKKGGEDNYDHLGLV